MNLLQNTIKRIQDALSSRPNLRKVTDSVFWLFLDKIIRLFVGLFVGAWLARYLAPELYGIYHTAFSFSALFGIVAGLGLRRVVVRELVNHPEQKEAILGSTFSLLTISGTLFWGVTVLSAAWFYQDDWLLFCIIAIISMRFIFLAFENIIHFFEAETQLKYTVYATSIAYLISNTIKVLLIIMEADLIAFAALFVVDSILGMISLIVLYHKKGYRLFNWTFSRKIATQLLKDGSPLIFAGLMVTVNARIDQIMLREMTDATQVGIYAAAVQLLSILFFVPNILKQSLFPNIVKEHANNTQAFYEKLEIMLNMLYGFSYIAIIGLFLFADFIIFFLFGEAYAASAAPLRILSVLLLFISINAVKNSYLIIHNWTRLKLVFSIIAATTNVGINLILIPKYGILGACYASLLSYGISAYFATWLFPELNTFSHLMTRSLFLTRLRKLFS